ncbi:hypothetical protein NHX12_019071 [Muraenolepis orangiensis]|uniref:Uncharacterized protein n=1 Tax=Muraenolepis orangiensis TaxID=630683 RepID=A0A9Q0EWI4_9TELE|nr:hypothetical protein NHX12_019071 [Muraenolepis orangiensis]
MKTLFRVKGDVALADGSTCSSDAGDVLVRSTTTVRSLRTDRNHNITDRKHKDTTVRSLRNDRKHNITDQKDNTTTVNRSPVLGPALGQDVLTSHYRLQGREALSSALKHRSHTAPMRREVQVQLLAPVPPESGCLSSCQQGAVTTATVAATVPLIQAHSQLEVRVSQLTDSLRRLQETNSQQCELSSRPSDHLLQRLEILQNQHLLLQRHLLDSTPRMTTGHALVTPVPPPLTLHLSPPAAPPHLAPPAPPLPSAPAPPPPSALAPPAALSAPPTSAPPPPSAPAPPARLSAPPPPSVVQEAARVLRDVRRQRKVLEENLDTMLRARDTEALHCQLDALSANRDYSEALRVRRTVDAWITSLSHDPQALDQKQAAVPRVWCSLYEGHRGGLKKPPNTRPREPPTPPRAQPRRDGLSARLVHHPETSNMAALHATTGSNMAALHATTGSNMAALHATTGSNMAASYATTGSNMAALHTTTGSNMAAVEVLNPRATAELQEDSEQKEQQVIQVSGQPSPPAALYHGPTFPPSTSSVPLPAQDQASVLGLIHRGEALENRLLEW